MDRRGFSRKKFVKKVADFFIFLPANAIYHISHGQLGLVTQVNGKGAVPAGSLRWHGVRRAATHCEH
jgi:hypothetical protein